MPLKIKNACSYLVRLHWAVWLVLFLISASVSVVALRHNNLEMVSLRDAVYTADKNNKNLEPAIDSLSSYVHSHMNTSMTAPNGIYPPLQLSYTYARLAKAQTTQNSKDNYAAAQAYCQAHATSPLFSLYVSCIQAYVQRHPVKTVTAADISPALYEFDFISPSWSPDLAGWSLAASGLFLLGGALRLAADRLRA